MSEPKHKHYHKDVSDRQTIDIYGVCEVFEVDDVSGRLHHAIKKILMAGKRGSKGYRQDIQEAVDTLNEKLRALDSGKKNDAAWTSHDGSECPVNDGAEIDILYRDGSEMIGTKCEPDGEFWRWDKESKGDTDIMGYRVYG